MESTATKNKDKPQPCRYGRQISLLDGTTTAVICVLALQYHYLGMPIICPYGTAAKPLKECPEFEE